jgi:hypothetical protein
VGGISALQLLCSNVGVTIAPSDPSAAASILCLFGSQPSNSHILGSFSLSTEIPCGA